MELDLRHKEAEGLVRGQIPGPGLESPDCRRSKTTRKVRQIFEGDQIQVLKNRKTSMHYSDSNVMPCPSI